MEYLVFIINGRIRSAKKIQTHVLEFRALYPNFQIEAEITDYPRHAEQIALKYRGQKCAAIIACGGDGTINEVVNALMQFDPNSRPALGILPMGSANDFARLIARKSLPEIVNTLIDSKPSYADVVKLETKESCRHSLNMTVAGIGAEIAQTVNARKSWLPAAINYYSGILQWLITYKSGLLKINIDGHIIEQHTFLMAAGKGKYAGNGLGLLPHSALDNGVISLCVIGDVNVIDFLRYQNTLKRCEKINDPRVQYLQGKSIQINVLDGTLAVDTDGEFFTRVPNSGTLKLTLEPRAIRLL